MSTEMSAPTQNELRANLVASIQALKAVRDDAARVARLCLDEGRVEAYEAAAAASTSAKEAWRALSESYRLLGVRPS
jgi:hypothetical protein